MEFKISNWYNNFQAPSVLMIDDLSDSYIDIYKESYKNDWGYLSNSENSSYSFLKKELLDKFYKIKITFFIPYLKHNVINDNTKENFKKYDMGERKEFIDFLLYLKKEGHEMAHHGSNHGEYIDKYNLYTENNFKHEWELFKSVEEGVKKIKNGKEVFEKYLSEPIHGGKFCGYKQIENSLTIIDKSNFYYWCDEVNYLSKKYNYHFFGKNNIISFPTNFAGNSFNRFIYITNNKLKDKKKKFLKYLQPIYNIKKYYHLIKLYKNGYIISIQEHISPSTSSGITQSANIISDIKSLNKIYSFLIKKSIWYATCEEISKYIYIKENSSLSVNNTKLIIDFNNYKSLKNTLITIISNQKFTIEDRNRNRIKSLLNNTKYKINIHIQNGKNIYKIVDNNV